MSNNVLILERSSQNLQKISKGNKTVLEGVFCEFGSENRNGRVYQENAYLPHLEYLKKDIANGNLLGELDHPERFEVQLSNVSHRVTDIWYDQAKRQILGRVEILDGTPKGQIAKSLLDAGIPLSISSRAAGTVNDDKSVSIQQIYTYDLVAKPGFEAAQLHNVNESYRSNIQNLINKLNESYNIHEKDNMTNKLGIVNENISIIDVTDKFPAFKLREEAKILNKNNENNMDPKLNEDAVQQWTVYFKNEVSKLNDRLGQIEGKILENVGDINIVNEIKLIKSYVEKLRSIQENSLNWQSDIAKATNKIASYANNLAEKSNEHYDLTQKLVETVDYNAKTLNHTQDWIGDIAQTTNAIGETVDHNAKMLNGVNEWNTQISKAVNKIYEWGEEKAKAINDMHEWVSTQAKVINNINEWTGNIAKNLNHSVNWTEDMFGKAISKEDAKRLVEYIELVSESKQNPELKLKIDTMLTQNNITEKLLSEASFKGIEILDADNLDKMKDQKNDDSNEKNKGVSFDEKSQTIIAKMKDIKLKKEGLPKGLKTLDVDMDKNAKLSVSSKVKGVMVIDTTKTIGKGEKSVSGDGPKNTKNQNLKLDVKPEGKLKENLEIDRTETIKTRSTNLDNKLSKIIETLEKERSLDEQLKGKYPFTTLLSEDDRKRFASLDATDKEKVNSEISKVPTTDPKVITKIWESSLNEKANAQPLWLRCAPEKYKTIFESVPQTVKDSIVAKAEYFDLNNQYSINNFWETSGLVKKPLINLNESVLAKTPEESEQKFNSFVAQVGEQMKKYNY